MRQMFGCGGCFVMWLGLISMCPHSDFATGGEAQITQIMMIIFCLTQAFE